MTQQILVGQGMPELIASTNAEGQTVIAVVANGYDISEPRLSTCGRFEVSPAAHGLTDEQAATLESLNRLLGEITQAAYREVTSRVKAAINVQGSRMADLFFGKPEDREPLRRAAASYILAELREQARVPGEPQQETSGSDTKAQPAGDVVVTWDERRARILAVTRQDADGQILSVIAEAPAQADRYLLTMEGDVEPVLEGPFASDELRLARARERRAESDDDGVYRLDVSAGAIVEVEAFTGAEIEEDELSASILLDLVNGYGGIRRLKIDGGLEHFTFQWGSDEVVVSPEWGAELARKVRSDLVIVDSMTSEIVLTRQAAMATLSIHDWYAQTKAKGIDLRYEDWAAQTVSTMPVFAKEN